jgi:hypothetical protein
MYLPWHLIPHITMQCTCFGNLFCRSLYNVLALEICSADPCIMYLLWKFDLHISKYCNCSGNLLHRSLFTALALASCSTNLYVLYLLCLHVPRMSIYSNCLGNLFHISLYTALCLEQCDTNRVNTILSCIIQGSQDKQACTVPSFGCFIDAITKNFTMEMLLMVDILGENLAWQLRACLV